MIKEIFDKINKCIDENKYTYYYTEEDENGKCACSDTTITSDGLSELLCLLENDLYVLAIANEQSVQEGTEIIAELKAENGQLKSGLVQGELF